MLSQTCKKDGSRRRREEIESVRNGDLFDEREYRGRVRDEGPFT